MIGVFLAFISINVSIDLKFHRHVLKLIRDLYILALRIKGVYQNVLYRLLLFELPYRASHASTVAASVLLAATREDSHRLTTHRSESTQKRFQGE